MRKISGHVVSTKATTVSRAAEIISRFAAVDNGSSPAVALYLQRTADAFNHLVQFHDKRSKWESNPKLQTNAAEKSLDGNEGKDSENKERKKDKKIYNNLDETNLKGDEAEDVEISEKKKKKKRTKSDDGDMKEKSSGKKKSKLAADS